MDKLMELSNTTELVKAVLKLYPQTRSSDNHLYYQVCRIIGRRNGIDIENMSMPSFFLNMAAYGFPAFETVRRSRQKLQATYPELSADGNVEAQRRANEEIFRGYAQRFV